MNEMFQGCCELKYLDLSNFDTSNVTSMRLMFNQCYKLKEIQGLETLISNIDTDITDMFQDCYELEF